MKHKALNQLVCAALVNDRFRKLLLNNPDQAIRRGYYGHSFILTSAEEQLLENIHTRKFEEFAENVYQWISAGDETVGSRTAIQAKSPGEESSFFSGNIQF